MRVMILSLLALAGLAFTYSPARADDQLIGMTIDEAKKTDFFTFFNLGQTAADTDAHAHRVLTFQPTGEKFHKLVALKVTLGADQRINKINLALARSFVDNRADGIFARDIAKSLLRESLSRAEVVQVADLIKEIQYGFSGQGFNGTVIRSHAAPELPAVPTPGYEVYLGKRDSFERELGHVRLDMQQARVGTESESLVITISTND